MRIARFSGGFGRLFLALLVLASMTAGRAASPGQLIGLFTDYGWDDPYVAEVKGTIVTIAPRAEILDLFHSATPLSVSEGGYLLDQAAAEFPGGTIFVAVMEPSSGAERDAILLETGKGKFYVGRDNGLFTRVIAREGFVRAWKLDKADYFREGAAAGGAVRGLDIFGPIAAHLAAGTDPDRLGSPLKAITLLATREANLSGETISAEVQHIDRLGNVILNLRNEGEISAKLKEGNLVKVLAGRESFSGPLVKSAGEVGKGRLLLFYGGSGLLEISVNQGSAAKMLKVEAGTVIFLKP